MLDELTVVQEVCMGRVSQLRKQDKACQKLQYVYNLVLCAKLQGVHFKKFEYAHRVSTFAVDVEVPVQNLLQGIFLNYV